MTSNYLTAEGLRGRAIDLTRRSGGSTAAGEAWMGENTANVLEEGWPSGELTLNNVNEWFLIQTLDICAGVVITKKQFIKLTC